MLKRILAKAGVWALKRSGAAPGGGGLIRLLRPEVRDRWRFTRVSDYTPERIEAVLRGVVAGELVAQWELFDLMEESWPRLAKNLAELKGALQECEWAVQAWAPADGEASAEAKRRALLLEEAIWHSEPDPTLDENDWQDLLRDVADAWGKGLSVQELHWAPRSYEGGTLIGLRAAHWVHPRYYGYPTGGTGTEDRLMIRTRELPDAARLQLGSGSVGDEWLPFPPDKFLVAIAKQRTGHPITSALLRTLAWWWCASNFTAEWLLNLAQIFGVPIRWATYDANASEEVKRQLEEMLEQMGSEAWAAFPTGTTMELKEGVRSAEDNPQKVLHDTADTVCDLLILGQTLTSDVGSSGSRALGDVHQAVLTGRKNALVKWVAKVLNQQFVPAWCRLNFGDVRECPYFLAGEDLEEDAKKLAERDEILARLGMEFPKAWFYERHQVPMPGAGDETIGGEPEPADPGAPGSTGRPAVARAKSAQEKLTDAVMEDLTGVEAKWLAGAKPFFRRLIALALSKNVTDGDFVEALERAQRQIPDLFDRLDVGAVQRAMEKAMGAAVVNGAVEGYLKRGGRGS
jgi:phage gp29-like protein